MSSISVSQNNNFKTVDYDSIIIPDPDINFPGILNVVKAPFKMASNIAHFMKCFVLWDVHGMKDGLVSFISSFNAFVHAACYLSGSVIDYLSKDFPKTMLTSIITVTGFIICAVEFLNESYRLIQQISFHKKLFFSSDLEILKESTVNNISKFLENLEKILEKKPDPNLAEAHKKLKEQYNFLKDSAFNGQSENVKKLRVFGKKVEAFSYLSNIKYIEQKYLSLSNKEEKKILKTFDQEQQGKLKTGSTEAEKQTLIKPKSINLARRIQPILFKTFKEESKRLQQGLDEILNKTDLRFEDMNSTLQESQEFFNKVQAQSIKAMKIHGIALFSLGIAITSTVATLFTFPLALPISLSAISAILGIYTGFAKEVMLPADGDNYHWYQILPKFMQKAFGLDC